MTLKGLHALGLPVGLLVLAEKSNTSCRHGSLPGCLTGSMSCVCTCVRARGGWLPCCLAATTHWHVALWSSAWALVSSSSYPDLPCTLTHILTHPGTVTTTVTFSVSSSFGITYASLPPSFLSSFWGAI